MALRAHVVARSRYAEDTLAEAVRHAGVRQYVLLGAGLDTFAYRNPHRGLRVFEVDHPATQAWKLDRLHEASIAHPGNLCLVPVDFERQHLADELAAAGFDPGAPTVFSWLGVVPYLTREAFRSTLALIAGCPRGSGVVLDYGQPRRVLPPLEQLAHDSLAERVALAGEPFRSYFTPGEMAAELTGFSAVEDLDAAAANAVTSASGPTICASGERRDAFSGLWSRPVRTDHGRFAQGIADSHSRAEGPR